MLKCTSLSVFLLAFALYMGQLAAIVHAAEHPFHETAPSCQIFVSHEQHDESLNGDTIRLPVLTKQTYPVSCIDTDFPLFSSVVYLSRAPPFSL